MLTTIAGYAYYPVIWVVAMVLVTESLLRFLILPDQPTTGRQIDRWQVKSLPILLCLPSVLVVINV